MKRTKRMAVTPAEPAGATPVQVLGHQLQPHDELLLPNKRTVSYRSASTTGSGKLVLNVITEHGHFGAVYADAVQQVLYPHQQGHPTCWCHEGGAR